MLRGRHIAWLIALLASGTGAQAAVRETIEVLYPKVPVIIARGEPLELKVRVTSGDMIGGATYRGIQRPPGARAPQGVVPASGQCDSEDFTFALDSNALPVGDYGFLLEAYRLSRKPVNAVARAQVTVVEKAPLTIVAPARGSTFKEDFEIATQADAAGQLAGVSVFKDDAPFFRPETPSFKRTWEVGGDVPGEHTLTVDAVDARGRHYVTSTTVTILPRITLTGSVGSSSTELSGLFEGGSRAWSFAPTLSLPIFAGGRNRANLDLAEVRQDAAVADYEGTIQTAFREVADALAATDTLRREEAARRALAESSRAAEALAEARYRGGVDDHLRYLDAQRSSFNDQTTLIQISTERQLALADLFRALGGGWQR